MDTSVAGLRAWSGLFEDQQKWDPAFRSRRHPTCHLVYPGPFRGSFGVRNQRFVAAREFPSGDLMLCNDV